MLVHTLTLIYLASFCRISEENSCGRPIGYESTGQSWENRIVGGYDVGYYKYPWYVAFIKNKIVDCGGSLINSKTILTAAHCYRTDTKARYEDYYIIKLGVYNMCSSEDPQVEFKAEKVKIHELYFKKSPYYDIAIVILKEDATKFTPICLPNHRITQRPREGLVPGLGVLKYDGATPCTLHESRLLIHKDDDCKSMLVSVEKNVSHIIKAFCAGYTQGGIDTCQGDSGGPLQIVEKNGDYTLLGIVSFGYRCADPGVLGLYTDVSQHLEWIKKNSVGSILNKQDNDDSSQTTSQTINEVSTETIISNPQLESIPLPSIGMKPYPSLQFYPLRPLNQRLPPFQHHNQQSPINIFIFNKKRQPGKKITRN